MAGAPDAPGRRGRTRTAASPSPAARRGADPQPTRAFAPSALSEQLSGFEFSLIIALNGFHRWVETCMEVAQVRGLSALDILVLHAVNHRARGRRLSEICTILNIDDAHLVAYALKKLVAASLVAVERRGRERHFASTPAGDEACLAYRRVREQYLVPSVAWALDSRGDLPRDTAFLRSLAAIYDQAGRFAMAESHEQPKRPAVRTKR